MPNAVLRQCGEGVRCIPVVLAGLVQDARSVAEDVGLDVTGGAKVCPKLHTVVIGIHAVVSVAPTLVLRFASSPKQECGPDEAWREVVTAPKNHFPVNKHYSR